MVDQHKALITMFVCVFSLFIEKKEISKKKEKRTNALKGRKVAKEEKNKP